MNEIEIRIESDSKAAWCKMPNGDYIYAETPEKLTKLLEDMGYVKR